jgi:hypothetical protein
VKNQVSYLFAEDMIAAIFKEDEQLLYQILKKAEKTLSLEEFVGEIHDVNLALREAEATAQDEWFQRKVMHYCYNFIESGLNETIQAIFPFPFPSC